MKLKGDMSSQTRTTVKSTKGNDLKRPTFASKFLQALEMKSLLRFIVHAGQPCDVKTQSFRLGIRTFQNLKKEVTFFCIVVRWWIWHRPPSPESSRPSALSLVCTAKNPDPEGSLTRIKSRKQKNFKKTRAKSIDENLLSLKHKEAIAGLYLEYKIVEIRIIWNQD